MKIKGVIFDLDGVIVSTDEYHYLAWKKLADEEAIYFDRKINERLRGVSRIESLNIMLEKAEQKYSKKQKLELTERKNSYYREMLKKLTSADILPGTVKLLEDLKNKGVKIAIGSSSRNSQTILEYIGLKNFFDASADGNDIENSKPHPEVFLTAAQRLGLKPPQCLVVEDAEAGVEAAINAGMKVLAVGSAKDDGRAHIASDSLEGISAEKILNL